MITWFLVRRLCVKSPQTILHGRDAILRAHAKWLMFNMISQLWADMKYHVPTGFGFSPKASGFYPFGDAAALAGEGGVGDEVWLIQATAWNQTCRSTNDRCEALASLKGCFLCFCFSPPVFIHWTRLNPTTHHKRRTARNLQFAFYCEKKPHFVHFIHRIAQKNHIFE